MLKQSMLIFLLGFSLPSAATDKKDIKCLADNIYHEARSESKKAQIATGIITSNRAKVRFFNKRNPICSAVYEKGQFSWTRNRTIIREKDIYKDIVDLSTNIYYNYFIHNHIPHNLSNLRDILYYAEKGYRPIKNGIRIASIDSFYYWKSKKVKV